jgi:hypothetical protein
LLFLILGFLASAQLGVAPLFFGTQALLLFTDDRRARHDFLDTRLGSVDDRHRFGLPAPPVSPSASAIAASGLAFAAGAFVATTADATGWRDFDGDHRA